jgi:hypothetical protein
MIHGRWLLQVRLLGVALSPRGLPCFRGAMAYGLMFRRWRGGLCDVILSFPVSRGCLP